MSGLLKPEQVAELPAVRAWLAHAEATARIIKENYGHIREPNARLTATVEENVLVQLENLKTHPCVLAALSRRELKLHGWVYKFEAGEVFSYHPSKHAFLQLDRGLDLPSHEVMAMPAI
jgi:carbonic anhydrase